MISVSALQDTFVARLPWMRSTARAAFQNLDAEKRDEAVSNTVALAWKAWHRLNERGKANEPGILKAICWFVIKQTRAGRRIDHAGKPRDPLALRVYGKVTFEPWNLEDYIGKDTPIPDAVSFRVDVPAFLSTLSKRHRSIALDLTHMTTGEVAEKYGVSPGRISQIRQELKALFDQFFAD